ncbi:MAG: NAD(P)/FAD-dependent oxidoreductase [Polaromonas sp.]
MDTDVLIVGAGPAGSCAALNLAPFSRVLLIDRQADPVPRAGESLPPAANKLLADMGLLEDFKQQGHLPCFGNQSRWGSDHVTGTDFLRDPMGHGWHLERRVFERWLRRKAELRGASLWAPSRLGAIEASGDDGFANGSYPWVVRVEGLNGSAARLVRAKVLIDAGGRTPGVAKRLGAERTSLDTLCCAWSTGTPAVSTSAEAASGAGASYIEADEHGWWYTAPLPNGKRIISFHADADTLQWMSSEQSLLAVAATRPALAAHLVNGTWAPQTSGSKFGLTAANSALTRPCTGPGWLCVGDAALSFDPLSSQGIFNALYSGLAAAEAVERHLRLGTDFGEYGAQINSIEHAYRARLAQSYGAERRFESSSFWVNRRSRQRL